MGISQNFNKNLKKSIKKQTPHLPVGSKFIFQQLLKNSHHIEEDLEDTTIVEYNVGDLKQVIKNMKGELLMEKKNCDTHKDCPSKYKKGWVGICKSGKCEKCKNQNYPACLDPQWDGGMISQDSEVGMMDKDMGMIKKESLNNLIKRTVKENVTGCGRKEGKCCDGGDGRKCGAWTTMDNGDCKCSYAGPCCSGKDSVRDTRDTYHKSDDVEVEMGEATSTASSGAYVTPRFWAKNKKNQRFSTERWMPGAQYVKVKDKCKKFPYCNQGDINALKIWEQDIMKESAKKVAKKTGKSESEVREMVEKEIAEIIRRGFYKSPIKDLVGGGKMNTPIGKMFTMKGNKPKYES